MSKSFLVFRDNFLSLYRRQLAHGQDLGVSLVVKEVGVAVLYAGQYPEAAVYRDAVDLPGVTSPELYE